MSACTDVETIKAARKQHRCSWCNERIEVGQTYMRWRYFGDDVGTCRVHPECDEALKELSHAEGGYVEFCPGDFPRGCTCGFDKDCKRCNERKEKGATHAK